VVNQNSKGLNMDMNTIVASLQATQPFKYLNKVQSEIVYPLGQLKQFNKNETILAQGKSGYGLYIILKGKVEVSVSIPGKENKKLVNLETGNFFGPIHLVGETLCTTTIIAKSKVCTCFYLGKHFYDALELSHPEIGHILNKAILEYAVERQRFTAQILRTNIKNMEQIKRPTFNIRQTPLPPKKEIMTESLEQELFYLYKLPMFDLFSKEDFSYLLRHCSRLTMYNCTKLIKAGDVNSSCYFIISGSVELTLSYKNKKTKVAMFGPNTLICPISCLTDQEEVFHYRTATQAVLLEFTYKELEILKRNHIHLWYKYYDLIFFYIISLPKKLHTQMVRIANEQFKSLVLT
jgi:CRP-like cAMP-binding protein